jgi:hypothetical protein
MKDAIATPTGLVLAAATITAIVSRTPDRPVVELPAPPIAIVEPATECTCAAPGVADRDQQRALELACAQYGDDACHHRFEVFSTVVQGPMRVVFVRRSTGDCGGCGALTAAVIFRGDAAPIVDKLGRYGRFGNGPDAIEVRDVVGRTVIVVDETVSMSGYTDTYREYFVVDRDRVERQLCLQIAGSDAGATEHESAWDSSNWIAAEGTMYFSPSYTTRGDVTPQLYAFSFPFEHGRWKRYDDRGGWCLDPRLLARTST